ncbi:hypothetical protein RhiirC2_798287 [Rhizophagus irregularis]|uniref:Uncharacterized protein n=1 Tax=Rhizophagus irregularis TaxID=588596 RepID=A0A2N1M6N3_9GLOM|nr:hypothetical protein RhiirC2_798287 [Rhizophagus irregularis]
MSTERIIEIHLQFEDNYIDIINIENLTLSENLIKYRRKSRYTGYFYWNRWFRYIEFHCVKVKEDQNFEVEYIIGKNEKIIQPIQTSLTCNIISYLNRKHKIYEHSKPLSTITPFLKQLILDFQPFYLLKSPSFYQFINALNENFELPTDKEF